MYSFSEYNFDQEGLSGFPIVREKTPVIIIYDKNDKQTQVGRSRK